MIFTAKEFERIKKAKIGSSFPLTMDTGLTQIMVEREKNQAVLNGGLSLDLRTKIKDNFFYLIDEEGVKPLAFFSEDTHKFYKLLPTADWPSVTISSVPMHNSRSPKEDSYNKIHFLKPYGRVLDTCMGLGYTAILAAETAGQVVTFEKDDNIYQLAQINPFSRKLFSSSNIAIYREDVFNGIEQFGDNSFDCITHDPPTFKLAGELFSQEFYHNLRTVLKKGGKLFHYTPRYKLRQGFDFASQVKKRLIKAGFTGFSYSSPAQGLLCRK